MAAERLASAGLAVTVYDRMPSLGRKLLMAGRGGLNLTHSEPLPGFLERYGPARDRVAPLLARFSPDDLRGWCDGLGQPTFTGSSGRVFPAAMKASPLLRAWLARLAATGVRIATRHRWTGWDADGALAFATPDGPVLQRHAATLLALGGASWPRLGSDGGWAETLSAGGIALAPFRPANAGILIAWSAHLRERFAGTPLKRIALAMDGASRRGEAVLTAAGLEGGAVYALSAPVRAALDRDGEARLALDLRPDRNVAALTADLARPRGKASLANHLRKAGRLPPVAIALLRESGAPIAAEPDALARLIKAVPLLVTGLAGLDRAISTAGGVRWDELDDALMLRKRPGTFVAGEMIDWEAPTGGYLLQASFASGVAAAEGALAWLAQSGGRPSA
ncbi:MAG: TIGR03862 family flavoprotein [Methylobacteriaceae bacterium]|nr:TIGR03862 family flavoprotein [Methylobacteriaceae bacterium]